MKDPYEILGVSREADLKEIKHAFRVLAHKYHPDMHNGDQDKAKLFIEVKAAYKFITSNESIKRTNGKSKKVQLDDWAEAYNNQLEAWSHTLSISGEYRASGDWTVGELEDKLMEFFEKHGTEATSEIYSRRQRFQVDGIGYWISRGLMEAKSSWTGDQSGSIFYGLTEDGIDYFTRKRLAK
ncbi:MAG: DnaJ domain-containing protein [Nanoarchaeota archaeon]|nr:DnaJ domain-containing protein [Nanoarchaeota archaeon]